MRVAVDVDAELLCERVPVELSLLPIGCRLLRHGSAGCVDVAGNWSPLFVVARRLDEERGEGLEALLLAPARVPRVVVEPVPEALQANARLVAPPSRGPVAKLSGGGDALVLSLAAEDARAGLGGHLLDAELSLGPGRRLLGLDGVVVGVVGGFFSLELGLLLPLLLLLLASLIRLRLGGFLQEDHVRPRGASEDEVPPAGFVPGDRPGSEVHRPVRRFAAPLNQRLGPIRAGRPNPRGLLGRLRVRRLLLDRRVRVRGIVGRYTVFGRYAVFIPGRRRRD